MKIPRPLRLVLAVMVALLLVTAVTVASAWLYLHPGLNRSNGIIYGHRNGKDLTIDILRPSHPNGLGVALMVSGGWRSGTPGSFQSWIASPLLRHGYTIFAVYHISQPEATVSEIVEDVNHGIRFIRHHSAEYGIDGRRLGVTGGSAGGHLGLMLGTRGGPGLAGDPDPVQRETSAVQAVAIFYPVTDLLNLGASTENLHDGGPPKSFVRAFGWQCTNLTTWTNVGRELSPIYHINSNLPPTLIYHGDADTLVPLDQSERFCAKAAAAGRTVQLVVHRGGKHGWWSMIWDLRTFAAWFDRYLAAAHP